MKTYFRAILFFILLLLGRHVYSLSSTTIRFFLMYGDKVINLKDDSVFAEDAHGLEIQTIKFYISNIHFVNSGDRVYEEKNSFHLIDVSNPHSTVVILGNDNNFEFDELRFNLGIDSLTNVSGALGGDLDPTKGMYWAWQSGYIHFKLEGKSKYCNTRNNEFQLHLGGYMQPYNCLQSIQLKAKNAHEIKVVLDMKKIIDAMDCKSLNHIMSPGKEAMAMSKIIANSFTINKN